MGETSFAWATSRERPARTVRRVPHEPSTKPIFPCEYRLRLVTRDDIATTVGPYLGWSCWPLEGQGVIPPVHVSAASRDRQRHRASRPRGMCKPFARCASQGTSTSRRSPLEAEPSLPRAGPPATPQVIYAYEPVAPIVMYRGCSSVADLDAFDDAVVEYREMHPTN